MERRSTRNHRKEEEAEEDSSGDYDAAKTTKPLSRALKCIQAFNKVGNKEGNTETAGGKRKGDGDRGGGLGLDAASASTRSGRGTRVGGGGGGGGTNAASASLRTKPQSSRRGTDSTTGNDDEGVVIDNSDKKRKNTKTTQNKSNKKTTMTKVTKQRLRLHYHGTDVGDEDEDDNKEEQNQQAVYTKEENDNDKNERKRQHKAIDTEEVEEEEVGDDDEIERKEKAEEGEEEEEEVVDDDDDDDDGGGRHRRAEELHGLGVGAGVASGLVGETDGIMVVESAGIVQEQVPDQDAPGKEMNTGHWSKAEHNRFLTALDQYGTNKGAMNQYGTSKWNLMTKIVETRTSSQIRSYAQNYSKRKSSVELGLGLGLGVGAGVASGLVGETNNDTERYQQQKKRRRSSKSSSDGDAEGGGNSLPNTSKKKKSRNTDRKWLVIFNRLVAYQQNNGGSTKVPTNDSNDPSLGRWVKKQREHNNNNSIKPERRTKLDLIHFDWGEGKQPPRDDWETMFNRLVAYQQNNNGSTKVPSTYQDDLPLGNWVSKQREGYNNKSMKPERRTKLDMIHFDSGMGPRSREDWETMFNHLVAYKGNHNGSTKVPKIYANDQKLANWVRYQRWVYHKNGLSPDRVKLLKLIDFDFGKGKQPPRKDWKTMYQHLVTYKGNHNGSTRVPTNYSDNPGLANWVVYQRTLYHKNDLSPDRVQSLEMIHFDWGRGPRQAPAYGNVSVCNDASTVGDNSILVQNFPSQRRLQHLEQMNQSSNNAIPRSIASVSFFSKNETGEKIPFKFDKTVVDEFEDAAAAADDNDGKRPAATQPRLPSSFIVANTDSTSKDKNTATITQIMDGNGATMTNEGQGGHSTSNGMPLAPYCGDDVRYNSDGMPLVPYGSRMPPSLLPLPSSFNDKDWYPNDVLVLEDGSSFHHSNNPGNRQFYQVVEGHVLRYVEAETSGHQQAIIGSIVFEIQQRGSLFMKRSTTTIEEATTSVQQKHWCFMIDIQEIHTTIEQALQTIIAQHPDRYQQKPHQQQVAASSVAATTASPPAVLQTTIAASKNKTIGERWSAVKQQLLPTPAATAFSGTPPEPKTSSRGRTNSTDQRRCSASISRQSFVAAGERKRKEKDLLSEEEESEGGDDMRYNSSFVAAEILQATAAVSSTATVDNAEMAQDAAAVAATWANDDVQNITQV